MPGPLDGIRILDLSRILAGPFATQLLGDMGADVIKIERPGRGDDTRAWGPPFVTGADGTDLPESAYYLSANRNKRSVAVDMATEEGARLIRRLAGECDVVIENFKPGGLRKYGLDHDSLRALYPGLIYCSISGFGQTGPNAHRPGYDLLAQAMSGIMAITGDPEGEPMKVGVGIADVMCGMYAANAIQAALIHKMKTGEGQHIDIALADTTVSWLVNAGTNYLLGGGAERLGNAHPNIVPYQVFRVADGHVILAAGNDTQFARFCGIIGRPELAGDARFATNPARLENREMLIAELQSELAGWEKAVLIARMEEAGVPGGPINTLSEVFSGDQVKARDMRIAMEFPGAARGQVDLIGNPVKFSATPVTYRRPPPQCGAHTDEVLEELLGEAGE
ncbi:CaiB/BaiF CoA transferase family protein [Marimonas arenosa]|uniref:CoA transferase n=1 Tax=Marimonas arenosa TaxID=1795305 RepID=A0AAE3WCQ5_9RHOB|nr:CaiB/BaiF CoA-transferase family protein [Marimonas arenosa]MDQ2090224.1 CoA transferase [Marimonas arenosa]